MHVALDMWTPTRHMPENHCIVCRHPGQMEHKDGVMSSMIMSSFVFSGGESPSGWTHDVKILSEFTNAPKKEELRN